MKRKYGKIFTEFVTVQKQDNCVFRKVTKEKGDWLLWVNVT